MSDLESDQQRLESGEQGDRRSEPRTKSRVERTVVATLTDQTYGTLTNHLYLLDISPNGMRINLDRTMEPGSEFEMVFQLDSLGFELQGALRLLCEVVWSRPLLGGTCTIGLKFKEPDEDAQKLIEQLLNYWSNKHDFILIRLREPVNAKVRASREESWSRMVGVRKLSVEGFQFPTSISFADDQEIQVRMLLDAGTVETRAVVRWCERMNNGANSVGCEFLELSASGKGFIELHLRHNS
jgi:hypothetical protein